MICYAHDLDELKRCAAAQARSRRDHSSREAVGFAEAMREVAKSPIAVTKDLLVWATVAANRTLDELDVPYWRGYSTAMQDIADSVVRPEVKIPRYQHAFMEKWKVPV